MAVGKSQELSTKHCVCATLRKASRSVTQFYDNTLRPAGLRSTQFHILSEIKMAREITITELTKALVMDQTTLTRSLALLERDGLVSTAARADKRLKPVQLTKKGEKVWLAAVPLWVAAQREVMGMMRPEAWEALSMELGQLSGRLSG